VRGQKATEKEEKKMDKVKMDQLSTLIFHSAVLIGTAIACFLSYRVIKEVKYSIRSQIG